MVKYNSFEYQEKTEGPGQGPKGSGIWALASFMNDARPPSSTRVTVGEYMVVVAARDLREGEEVTTTYVAKGMELRHWGIHEEPN